MSSVELATTDGDGTRMKAVEQDGKKTWKKARLSGYLGCLER